MFKNTQIKGYLAERLTNVYLLLKGYRLLKNNDTSGGIEADVIALKDNTIVLVEVKYRASVEQGHVAVHPQQQKRLQKKLLNLSKYYANYNHRIDLVLICPTPPFIHHIKNTFSL